MTTERNQEIRSLTGLRGVAALYVVAYHSFWTFGAGYAGRLVRHGYLAVDLFFVLSGFVMALTYGAIFAGKATARDYLRFLYKRLGRIYPLYVFTSGIAVWFALIGLSGWDVPTAKMAIANIFLVDAWGIANPINGPSWSISAEFLAYLLFPALIQVTMRATRWRMGIIVAFCLVLLAFIATRSSIAVNEVTGGYDARQGPLDVFDAATPYPVLRCLAEFTMGLAVFRAHRSAFVLRVFGRGLAVDLVAVATLALLCVDRADLLAVAGFALLIAALTTGRGFVSKALASRPVYWLGLISYSIYLLQLITGNMRGPVEYLLDKAAVLDAPLIARWAGIAMTVALAACTYYGIEKPAREWSRRLAGEARTKPIAMEPSAP